MNICSVSTLEGQETPRISTVSMVRKWSYWKGEHGGKVSMVRKWAWLKKWHGWKSVHWWKSEHNEKVYTDEKARRQCEDWQKSETHLFTQCHFHQLFEIIRFIVRTIDRKRQNHIISSFLVRQFRNGTRTQHPLHACNRVIVPRRDILLTILKRCNWRGLTHLGGLVRRCLMGSPAQTLEGYAE